VTGQHLHRLFYIGLSVVLTGLLFTFWGIPGSALLILTGVIPMVAVFTIAAMALIERTFHS
jgi:hypothetical protein